MPKFRDIPLITIARYHVNVPWNYIQGWIEEQEVNMNPDFQRNYVWNKLQKEQYIEWVLRGGQSGKDIYFNHPGWMKHFNGEMVIVDGKQRVDAVLGFLNNKVKAYGYYREEYSDRPSTVDHTFEVHVADLASRKQVLQWYIDMNTGGTKHTAEEIKKVKALLKEES